MLNYEIRKVFFINHESVESYPLDANVDFDVYGVYHKEFHMALERDLLYWDADFDTVQEAEDFIMKKVDVTYEYKVKSTVPFVYTDKFGGKHIEE